MSDNNIPTPAATTPAPVTVATKAPKSKGLSIYNRVALVLLLVLVIATTTLFTFAVQKTKAQKDMQDEIQTLTEQKDALAAPAWCAQVCVTDDEPVSSHWWWTVTRADAQDSLPTRLDWDPSSARGRGGGLSVRIGLSEEGPIDLDLVADGPHALVAGCTGSGKSEALLGWLAAIAHCYSPEQVRFILIDYKGGATFARLEALPHTQALLTDLGAGATTRALEGIASILQRREESLSSSRSTSSAFSPRHTPIRWRSCSASPRRDAASAYISSRPHNARRGP